MYSTSSVSNSESHIVSHDLDNIHNHGSGRPRSTRPRQRQRALERLRSLHPLEDTNEPDERHRETPEIVEQIQNLRIRNTLNRPRLSGAMHNRSPTTLSLFMQPGIPQLSGDTEESSPHTAWKTFRNPEIIDFGDDEDSDAGSDVSELSWMSRPPSPIIIHRSDVVIGNFGLNIPTQDAEAQEARGHSTRSYLRQMLIPIENGEDKTGWYCCKCGSLHNLEKPMCEKCLLSRCSLCGLLNPMLVSKRQHAKTNPRPGRPDAAWSCCECSGFNDICKVECQACGGKRCGECIKLTGTKRWDNLSSIMGKHAKDPDVRLVMQSAPLAIYFPPLNPGFHILRDVEE